jgi:hypothetical protein
VKKPPQTDSALLCIGNAMGGVFAPTEQLDARDAQLVIMELRLRWRSMMTSRSNPPKERETPPQNIA